MLKHMKQSDAYTYTIYRITKIVVCSNGESYTSLAVKIFPTILPQMTEFSQRVNSLGIISNKTMKFLFICELCS